MMRAAAAMAAQKSHLSISWKGGGLWAAPEMWPPHMSWPVSLAASRMPLMRRPVIWSRYSYAPGRPRISSVFMPAVIASGLPDSVPACRKQREVTVRSGLFRGARASRSDSVPACRKQREVLHYIIW